MGCEGVCLIETGLSQVSTLRSFWEPERVGCKSPVTPHRLQVQLPLFGAYCPRLPEAKHFCSDPGSRNLSSDVEIGVVWKQNLIAGRP